MIKVFDSLIISDGDTPTAEILSGKFVISCGLSQRSTVTASSIDEDGFLCCIQRSFKTADGKMVVPQEFRVAANGANTDICRYLEGAACMLLLGMTASQISEGMIFY